MDTALDWMTQVSSILNLVKSLMAGIKIKTITVTTTAHGVTALQGQ